MKKTLSKILAVIIAVMLVVSAMPVAFAADGDIASGTAGDGVTWVLNSSGTLTISGEGEIVVDWYAPPWQNYNDSILNIVVEEGITKIPDTAFCYAYNLETLSIPASVTDISYMMFWGDCAIYEINVDTDNEIYISVDGILFSKDMTRLCAYPQNKPGDFYTIPDTVTTIGGYAFYYNSILQSITIPDTVTSLENSAFYGANIKSATIGSGIKTIPIDCFGYSDIESIVIPDGVEAIAGSAFHTCYNLNTVTIGTGVKTISYDVFNYCDSLAAIHYTGTEDTWNTIEIDEDNEVLNTLPVHYITEDSYKEGFPVSDCTTDGHTGGLYCEECDIFATGSVLMAPGHNYVDGICSVCETPCEHVHQDFDGICDICGEDVGFNEIKVGETKTAYINTANTAVYVKFLAETDGEFVITSDSADNNIDPYVTLYDSEGNEIEYDDDNGNALDFELVFYAETGETYYIALNAYNDGSEYTYTLDKYIAITHQPTAIEPYVELNDETDATYQWFTAEYSFTEITDQNADTVSYDWGTTSYDSENGWSGVMDAWETEDWFDFFTVSLKAGDVVAVEITGDFNDAGLYDYATDSGSPIVSSDGSAAMITVQEDGDYTFYVYADSADITVKAYLVNVSVTEIKGETSATLKNPVVGTLYTCGIVAQGKVLVSDIFEYTYFITHQPTSSEPYVELNEQGDATYQWYKAEKGYGEITDEDADPTLPMNIGESIYDEQSGWSGFDLGENMVYFFSVSLKAGDIISFETSGDATAVSLFYNETEGTWAAGADLDENGAAQITAPEDANYIVFTNGLCQLKAYANKTIYTVIDGQTTATLTDATFGTTYACKITVGEDVLTSDAFEYTYAITHQPTKAEPYVEVNDDTDAKYQWYTVTEEIAEVTDKDVSFEGFPSEMELPTYETQDGWTGIPTAEDTVFFFTVSLEAGETVKFVANEYAQAVALFMPVEGGFGYSEYFDESREATLTAQVAGDYYVIALGTTHARLKAYKQEFTYTKINGETAAEFKTTDKGLYACEVIFADGSTEMSQILNTNYQPGDVNDDGFVNNRDYALLMQYLNKWDVTVVEESADVTGDGNINNRDYALLMQYINKWDVELK